MLLLLILVVGLGSAGGDHFSQEEQQVLEELEHAGLLDVNLEDMLALEDSLTTEYDDYEDEMKMLEELRQAGVEELREAGLTEEEIESLLETDDYEEGEYEEYEVSEELDEAEARGGPPRRRVRPLKRRRVGRPKRKTALQALVTRLRRFRQSSYYSIKRMCGGVGLIL